MSATRGVLRLREIDRRLLGDLVKSAIRSRPHARYVHRCLPLRQSIGTGSVAPGAEALASVRSASASRRRVHAAFAVAREEEELDDLCYGPDQVVPAACHKTSRPDGAVSLSVREEGMAAAPPVSVHTLLHTAARRYPTQPALAVKRDGVWRQWTYAQYYRESTAAARAFIRLGLERFHSVCIMGANSPEWFIANCGAIMAGGCSTGLYANNTAEASCGIIDDSRAQVLVLDTHETVVKMMALRHKMPHVKAIVQWMGEPTVAGVISWEELLQLGESLSDDALQQRLRQQAVNQCCTLIYTSGTTGPPKGVMCSQDSITWSAKAYASLYQLRTCEESIVSYLPLNHIAGQVVDIYVSLPPAGTVYFAPPDALKGSLIDTLKEVRPTGFLTVPRLLEKIHEQLMAGAVKATPAQKAVAAWAKRQGANFYTAMQEGRTLSAQEQLRYSLAKALVFNKVKTALGLSNARHLTCGSAPLCPELVEYFQSLDLPFGNVYAMSESCSIGTVSSLLLDRHRSGSVGKVMPGAEIAVRPTELGDGGDEGELCFRGRHVFMGYLNSPEKTDETILDDGWMLSGDLGRVDEDGFVFVSGRAKEIIITAGGENIAPLPIEAAVKRQLPAVANAMVVGDGKKYLSMLLTIGCAVDAETMVPLDDLSAPARQWLKRLGSAATTVTELRQELADQPQGPVAAAIQRAIDKYNAEEAVSRVHQIKRWAVLPHEFSVPTGELSNTLKLKRSAVAHKYEDLIEELYSR